MKYFVIALLCCVAAATPLQEAKHLALYKSLLSKATSWVPAHPSQSRFFGKSDEELMAALGDRNFAFAEATANTESKRLVVGTTNTTNFDWREEKPCAVGAVRDQGSCGSCWSFGTTEFLTDRFEIATDCTFGEVLSPQYMVSCWYGEPGFGGCAGAITLNVYPKFEATGTVSETCMPYVSGELKNEG